LGPRRFQDISVLFRRGDASGYEQQNRILARFADKKV
jgi:hypothetical protein